MHDLPCRLILFYAPTFSPIYLTDTLTSAPSSVLNPRTSSVSSLFLFSHLSSYITLSCHPQTVITRPISLTLPHCPFTTHFHLQMSCQDPPPHPPFSPPCNPYSLPIPAQPHCLHGGRC